MTQYRITYLPDGAWQVLVSEDGIGGDPIGPRFAKASEARAPYDARTGVLRPSRGAADGIPPLSAAPRAGRGSGKTAAIV